MLSILNSKLLFYHVKQIANIKKDGYFIYDKDSVGKFPIIIPKENIAIFDILVDCIIWLNEYNCKYINYVKKIEEILDYLIYELYFYKYFHSKNVKIFFYIQRLLEKYPNNINIDYIRNIISCDEINNNILKTKEDFFKLINLIENY